MGASSGPVEPFIGSRRKPKAWGRIGSTALGGATFTKHTRDDDPDYLAADLGDPLHTPGDYDDVPAPWLEGILDEVGREPMPVVELPEVE